MNRYIEQLLEDLLNGVESQIEIRSHLELLGECEPSDDDEDFMDNCKIAPLSEIIGFKKEVFPPEEQLSDEQVALIYSHLSNLVEHYNFFLDFPLNISDRIKYNMLINTLDEETTWSNSFITNLEFCDYDYDNCPFGIELCQCKMYEDLG